MVQKVPPPPPLAVSDQALNRWLLSLTAILNSQGGIDPGSVVGLPATTAQVGVNTTDIATISGEVTALNAQVATINGQITTINGQIAALSGQVATLNGAVLALQANPVLFNGAAAPAAALGKIGDWYGNLTGGVGARVYIKTAAGVWSAFPF